MLPIKSNASKIFMAELILILGKFDFRSYNTFLLTLLKINEARYITLFLVSGSIKKLFTINYVNVYLFSIFVSIDFTRWKSVRQPHIAYIVIH